MIYLYSGGSGGGGGVYIIDNNCSCARRLCIRKMPSQHEPIIIGSIYYKARVVRQN